jgi:hypothetical protein
MNKGYLICRSVYENIPEMIVDPKEIENYVKKDDPFNLIAKDNEVGIKVFKCPLTGQLVEKSKVRKVYFC